MTTKILVLNSDFSFLHYQPIKKVIKLLFKDKVEPATPNVETIKFRCYNTIIEVPLVVRLIKYIRRKYKGFVKVSKRKIHIRDNFICCYCGIKLTMSECECEHVIPKSHGQKDITWENCVTSCYTCNKKKRNRTPSEAGMYMLYQPFQPTVNEFMMMFLNSQCNVKDVISNLLKEF